MSSSLPHSRARRGAYSSWLRVSSCPGVSVPRGIASRLPRLSAGRPVQTWLVSLWGGAHACREGLDSACAVEGPGSDSGPCFSWWPALGGFSSPLSASESSSVRCLGVGALAMAGSRVSNNVPQQATSCHLLAPFSTKLPSFPSKLGGKDDRRLPQAHAAFGASPQKKRGPLTPLLNRGDASA